MKIRYIVLIACLIEGCAVVPDSIRPEVQHMSHISQHFGSNPTNYGATTVEVMAHWDFPHSYMEVGEGIAVNKRWTVPPDYGYGEISGPREEFIARAGLIIPVK